MKHQFVGYVNATEQNGGNSNVNGLLDRDDLEKLCPGLC